MNDVLLQVEKLSVGFGNLSITDSVSFAVHAGEIYALVGESGCGKSVTSMALCRLLPRPGAKILSGAVHWNGRDLLTLSEKELRQVRGHDIAYIFQEPGLALNPVRKIGSQLRETARLAGISANHFEERIQELLLQANFSEVQRILDSYPHELSGGQLQRIMIVSALIAHPRLVVADEPTTALDVTVQAQVMHLLRSMCLQQNAALLLITHNLGLVAQYADRVGVMYAGRMVEEGDVTDVLNAPCHPYTQGLLGALPRGQLGVEDLIPIEGNVDHPSLWDQGCRFRQRCPQAQAICATNPPWEKRGSHRVRCVLCSTVQEAL